MPEYFNINAPHVVSEIFEDQEAAIINLITGNYYSLNVVGTKIWAGIEKGISKKEIIEELVNSFEGDQDFIADAVNKFFEELQNEGLISAAANANFKSEKDSDLVYSIQIKSSFVLPEIERFGDAQELLLLDPIHDVNERGFPHQREDAVN